MTYVAFFTPTFILLFGSAQPAAGTEFPLKYRLTLNIAEEVGAVGQPLTILGDPPKLKEEPRYNSPKPIYSTLLVGPNQDEHALVLDTSTNDGLEYDCLYLDANGDGRLTPDEKLASSQRDTGWTFGPAKVLVTLGNRRVPQWYVFKFVDYEIDAGKRVRNLIALNAGFYTGYVNFGNTRRLVAVVDNNGNGVYDDFTRSGGPIGDKLLIDLNGDGEFDIRPNSEESQALGRYVLVGDRYWQVHVAADGSAITLAPITKPLGTIRSEVSDFALLLRGDEGDIRVRGSGGVARLPAGKYTLVRCQFAINDSAGRRWVFSGSGENGITLDIPDDNPVHLTLGPPLTPKVEVTRIDKDKIALTLSLHGAGGESYNEIFYNDQAKPPVPKVRLHDSSGRELGQMDFHYG